MSCPEMDVLNDLYDRTHGIGVAEIQAPPVAAVAAERRSYWVAVWRELGFHTDNPVGSSRLLEVAMALSACGGSPRDMLGGLLEVAAADVPVNGPYEALLKELWIPARCHRERFEDAFDFLRPVPASLSPRQAYLVVRFLWDTTLYTEQELGTLRATLDFGRCDLIQAPNTPPG